MYPFRRILSVMGEIWNSQHFKDGISEIWWDLLSSIHDWAGLLHLLIWYLHNLFEIAILLSICTSIYNTCLWQVYVIYCLTTASLASSKGLQVCNETLEYMISGPCSLWESISIQELRHAFSFTMSTKVLGTVNMCQSFEYLKEEVMCVLLHLDIFNASEKSFRSDGNYEREMRMTICPIWFIASVWSRDKRIYVLRYKFMYNPPVSKKIAVLKVLKSIKSSIIRINLTKEQIILVEYLNVVTFFSRSPSSRKWINRGQGVVKKLCLTDQLPVFVNKDLLKHRHTQLFTYCVVYIVLFTYVATFELQGQN